MNDQDQVKMTRMNYEKDRPAAENPLKVRGSEPARRPPVAVCHPGAHRGHDPGGRDDGRGGLLGGGDLGRGHLRHHAPVFERRPLGADPHAQAVHEKDAVFHAPAGPEPGGLPQLRRRPGQGVRGPRVRKRHGHLPHLRRAQRLPQLSRPWCPRSRNTASTFRGASATP